ncbi:hypothetical protein TWF281_003096 [Arthrobotrys megalospora]
MYCTIEGIRQVIHYQNVITPSQKLEADMTPHIPQSAGNKNSRSTDPAGQFVKAAWYSGGKFNNTLVVGFNPGLKVKSRNERIIGEKEDYRRQLNLRKGTARYNRTFASA